MGRSLAEGAGHGQPIKEPATRLPDKTATPRENLNFPGAHTILVSQMGAIVFCALVATTPPPTPPAFSAHNTTEGIQKRCCGQHDTHQPRSSTAHPRPIFLLLNRDVFGSSSVFIFSCIHLPLTPPSLVWHKEVPQRGVSQSVCSLACVGTVCGRWCGGPGGLRVQCRCCHGPASCPFSLAGWASHTLLW